MKITAIRLAAAATLSSLVVTPAAAEEVLVAIPYGDINLSTPAGSELLAQRVQAGVRKACEQPRTRDLKAMAVWEECRTAALASAQQQLSNQGAFADAGGLATS